MRGGMRLGAGRPAWKPKTTQCRSIDVRRFQRDKLLQTGMAYGWQWMDEGGKVLSSISVCTHDGGITISYRIEGEDVAQRINITSTPCTYSGGRPWFVCPHCHKRRALLYLARQVACRTCFRMTFPSQSEDVVGRMWRKQQKIENRLYSGKRMQQHTRDRLIGELCRIEEAKDAALFRQMARLLGHDYGGKFW
jgi:hypothetical protein